MHKVRYARLIGLGLAVGALAACHPARHRNPFAHAGAPDRPMAVANRLDCPDTVHALTRTAQAADGRSCDYTGPQDEVVHLSLMDLGGRSPTAVLGDLDHTLQTESGFQPPSPRQSADNAAAASNSEDGDDDDHGRAKIDLPGFHIDADHGHAKVEFPGVSIDANGDDAQVRTGWGPHKNTVINAHSGRAEIRAGDVDANGADLVYLLASDKPSPEGYRAVGYIARGPASGPLVVGQFKSKSSDRHDHLGPDGLDKLVRLNVQEK